MEEARSWHYDVIARCWAEFNDDFRRHEIPDFVGVLAAEEAGRAAAGGAATVGSPARF